MIHDILPDLTRKAIKSLYRLDISDKTIQIQKTKKEFEGDFTIVLFGLTKLAGKSPEKLGHEIGEHLLISYPDIINRYNVIKGFLNLNLTDNLDRKSVV